MKAKFGIKLATNNLKRNFHVYIPYLIACACTVFTFFVYSAIGLNNSMESLPTQSDFFQTIFSVGKVLIGIFSIVFILYANSFFMKYRMKEIGLYSILGLEKRHIFKVLFNEVLITGSISILGGLLFGVVFGKAFFLVFMRLLNVIGNNAFSISPQSILSTVGFFGIVFLFTFFYNVLKIKRANSISLLKSESQGEKEPKNHWVITVIGIVLLGLGYFLSFNATMLTDFIIVAPIIFVATYLLFITGCITYLKHIKKNKKRFYKPQYFISVSNMLYRMKKNGVGLANICIISTAVMLLVSIVASLYCGKDNMLKNRFPFDMSLSLKKEDDTAKEKIFDLAKINNVNISTLYYYKSTSFTAYLPEGSLGGTSTIPDSERHNLNWEVTVIPLNDYNTITGKQEILKDNEMFLYSLYGDFDKTNMRFSNGQKSLAYSIKELSSFPLEKQDDKHLVRVMYLVCNNPNSIKNLMDNPVDSYNIYALIQGKTLDKEKFAYDVEAFATQNLSMRFFASRDIESQKWYSYFGGGLFLCIFLGMLFLIALILVIYFKQMSEGYEDQKRFSILQKVGMSQEEVRSTINKQIRIMFFLPIVGAILHMLVGFNLICRVLGGFYLTNTRLIFFCMFTVILIFAIVYFVVYSATAKVYYNLVNRGN